MMEVILVSLFIYLRTPPLLGIEGSLKRHRNYRVAGRRKPVPSVTSSSWGKTVLK
jgi:hypothetical protein